MDYAKFVDHGTFVESIRDKKLLGAIGLAGEAGEVLELFKKHLMHHMPMDTVDLVHELGDVRWYYQLILNTYGFTDEQIKQVNVNKLLHRYPEDYKDWDKDGQYDKVGS